METMEMEKQINTKKNPNGLKVLVFDEDTVQLDALCMALELYNHTCLKADCNAMAFEHLYETNGDSVDLIVIDLSAPGRISLEALRLCHLARPDIPIVVLAGLKSSEAIRYARTMGFPVLDKPFNPDELDFLLRRIAPEKNHEDQKE